MAIDPGFTRLEVSHWWDRLCKSEGNSKASSSSVLRRHNSLVKNDALWPLDLNADASTQETFLHICRQYFQCISLFIWATKRTDTKGYDLSIQKQGLLQCTIIYLFIFMCVCVFVRAMGICVCKWACLCVQHGVQKRTSSSLTVSVYSFKGEFFWTRGYVFLAKMEISKDSRDSTTLGDGVTGAIRDPWFIIWLLGYKFHFSYV